MKQIIGYLFLLLFMLGVRTAEAATHRFVVESPDKTTEAHIALGTTITLSVWQDGVEVLAPSPLAMTLTDGTHWGGGSIVESIQESSVNEEIETPLYKSNRITNHYNQTTVTFVNNWALQFRAYNDGIAYRFTSTRPDPYEVASETAQFTFTTDAVATVPYVYSAGDIEHQLFQAFENTYTTLPLSQLNKNRLMFLPLTVNAPQNKRVTITESDLRNYPGMYLTSTLGTHTLSGFFAPQRNEVEEHAGYNNLQVLVKSRHPYIAAVEGARTFPWRTAIVTRNDVELANTDMVYKLAEPNVLGDVSWIKPGKVAWDWWNNWNLDGVDFVAGVNNETYKYYIDFASKNRIEYVILDEGWSVNKVFDLMQVVPEIDIPELVAYANKRNVDIILWAGYYPFDRDMEQVCQHYSALGVKGFKVDFMNGDDQELVYFNERAAQMCAKYKLLVDLHGTYKPTGLERTYPNVINYEGVHGLEQMKWQPATVDQVTYDVTMPFIRMIAGPVDYTQGAMNNAVRSYNSLADTIEVQYYPSFTRPMSQGTRAHQFGEYIVFFSPLNMLCDTPTNYEKNPVSTEFIASVPTVWDETKVVMGEMGEYIVTARRKGSRWYIGGLNNWTARDITLPLSTLTGKTTAVTLYQDGVNAVNNGADFQKVTRSGKGDITIHMAPGGGFALIQ